MKKIRNNISKYAVLLALTATPLVVTSCRQELDINVDPNNPSEASLSGLLSGSQVGFAFALGGEGTRMPASIVQHYAGHRAQPLDYAQYRITSSSTDVAWGAFYNVLMGMRDLENKAAASGNRAYVGVSKLLQAHAFSVVTDMFGDIPFSEALQGRANITPAYDRQENIYPALIAMIDEGVSCSFSRNRNYFWRYSLWRRCSKMEEIWKFTKTTITESFKQQTAQCRSEFLGF